MPFDLTSIGIGLFVGAVLALAGAGGAILSIPLMLVFLNLPMSEAAPIALLMVFISASIGSIQGILQGVVRYKAAILIASIGALIAPLGVSATQYVSSSFLTALLIVILVYVAIKAFSGKNVTEKIAKPAPCEVNPITSKLFWTAACTKHLIVIGMLTGFLSGLLGVGGGFLMVPAFKRVTNLNHAMTIATTLMIISLVSISAFVSHLKHTEIAWEIAIPLIGSAVAAMLLTNQIKQYISDSLSQKVFASLCLLAAALICQRLLA